MSSGERLDWQQLVNPPKPARPDPALRPIINGNGDSSYGRAALTAELDQLLATGEGGRNDQLNRSAFSLAQLVAAGHLPDDDTQDQLRAAAFHIGLTVGEVEATLRSAFRAGVQQPRDVEMRTEQVAVTEVTRLQIAPAAAGDAQEGPADPEAARTSWWPLPIVQRAAQAAETPAPTHLVRDDGQPLCYSGKVNGLIGESESGKSWVALLAVVQALGAGQRVLLLDFEDSPASIHGRLNTLGVTDQQLNQLDYANPDESLGLAQSADLSEALRHTHQLIIVDGVNAAMAILGYDLNSNTDATIFAQKLLRPLASTGACVITVDHVPKNSEQRGKGGIGAQAKRAMVDGCTLLVEVVEPFGKGQSGALKLLVDKDRPGHVRGASSGSVYAGKAHLDSVAGQVRLHIAGPDLRPTEERPEWRPTGLMEKISRLLERAEQPMSGREIRGVVPGRAQTVMQAITELVAAGHIAAEKRSGRGAGEAYKSVRMYREDMENTLREPVPNWFPEPVTELVPGPVPPMGTGTSSTPEPEPKPDELVPGTRNAELDRPETWSDCNRCGKPTDPTTLDETAGYCRRCGRVMNP